MARPMRASRAGGELVAILRQLFRSHAFDADAEDSLPLPAGRLREHNGKPSAAGN